MTKKTRWEAKICLDGFHIVTEQFETLREAITEILDLCEHQADTTGDSVADTFWHCCESLEEVPHA